MIEGFKNRKRTPSINRSFLKMRDFNMDIKTKEDIKMKNAKKEIIRIEKFIRKETKNMNGLVLGVSGGVDSAVVAYLASNAIGKEKVHGLMMPYDNQSIEDGELVAKTLGINYEIINIKPIVESYKSVTEFFEEQLPEGNLRARVRMCLLYGYANKHGCKVIGTGNASEAAVGYFTKWGDGAVDLQPILHVYKTEIWELAKQLGIPEKIITKVPSAELWDGQTDEGELGISYNELDNILKGEKIEDKKLVEKVENMFKNSKHKRRLPKSLKRLE